MEGGTEEKEVNEASFNENITKDQGQKEGKWQESENRIMINIERISEKK